MKRIIPISSGKGGVGKTSFAINLALSLSRIGKTVLVDLDTGTSSIRNVIAAPIKRDLYHFFKRDESLDRCVTTLPSMLDGDGHFKNFGFVASPMHMINTIANLDENYRNRLIDGINGLDADYVVLDLRAGLDPQVTDFLPLSNTGILVFTPYHPAATLAASDIVKAILFKKMREFFHESSPVYQFFKTQELNPQKLNDMIDMTEDVYEPDLANLDVFIEALIDLLGDHPVVSIVMEMIEFFRVYYVLNRFDGVDSSYQTAVKPFVENISNNISPRVHISNLGWIIESKRYNQANVDGIPFVLQYHQAKSKPKRKGAGVDKRLAELYELSGLRKEKPAKRATKVKPESRTRNALDEQLNAIEKMFKGKEKENEIQNLDYIVSCLRYLFESKRISEFGDTHLLKRGEGTRLLLEHKLAKLKTQY